MDEIKEIVRIYNEEWSVNIMDNIKFESAEHKKLFVEFLKKVRHLDSYHMMIAYLFTLDTSCRYHIDDVFDFGGDGIKRDGLLKAWQTSTSARVTRLAFNLWNSCCSDGTGDVSPDGYDLPQAEFLPDEIFCDSLAEFFFEAIKLRYPQYFSVEQP